MSPTVTSSPDQPFLPSLRDLGWDEFFEVPFAEHASFGMAPARIARVARGEVTALTTEGPVRAITHRGHAPGCAVAEAVADGVLPERRLASNRKLRRENAWAAARTDARLRAERENHRRTISRDLRATYDFRGKQR